LKWQGVSKIENTLSLGGVTLGNLSNLLFVVAGCGFIKPGTDQVLLVSDDIIIFTNQNFRCSDDCYAFSSCNERLI